MGYSFAGDVTLFILNHGDLLKCFTFKDNLAISAFHFWNQMNAPKVGCSTASKIDLDTSRGNFALLLDARYELPDIFTLEGGL